MTSHNNIIVVSRHKAAIEFIRQEMCWRPGSFRVVESATADDVQGMHVYGNLPMHLAALAAKVTVVEFAGEAPRGQEYDLSAMQKAGARLVTYQAQPVDSFVVSESGDVIAGPVTPDQADRLADTFVMQNTDVSSYRLVVRLCQLESVRKELRTGEVPESVSRRSRVRLVRGGQQGKTFFGQ